MLDDFCLLLARSGLSLRYRHASRRVSQRALSCEIVSNPPFVAFRYSEDLYRREMTGKVMLRVPAGGIAGDPFPGAWSWLLASILLPSQWMNGAISPLSHLPRLLNFDPTSVGIGFVVDEVALGWISLRVLRISAVGIIPPFLYTLSFIHLLRRHSSWRRPWVNTRNNKSDVWLTVHRNSVWIRKTN